MPGDNTEIDQHFDTRMLYQIDSSLNPLPYSSTYGLPDRVEPYEGTSEEIANAMLEDWVMRLVPAGGDYISINDREKLAEWIVNFPALVEYVQKEQKKKIAKWKLEQTQEDG